MALAALRHRGVTGGTVTPPDAVVLGGRAFGSPRDSWLAVREPDALAVGYGVAAVRSRRTPTGRTWVLLRTRALRLGPNLEAAAMLADLDPVGLCTVVVGPPEDHGRAKALLEGVGVEVLPADNDDAWSVLSAMDRGSRSAEAGPIAVVATREAR